MKSFEIGKKYTLLAIPIWMRGVVAREDVRYVWLTPESAEYLPDAQKMGDYVRGSLKGEMLNIEAAVHKDTITVVLGPLDG